MTALFISPTVAQLRIDLMLTLRAATHHGLSESVCNHFRTDLPEAQINFCSIPAA